MGGHGFSQRAPFGLRLPNDISLQDIFCDERIALSVLRNDFPYERNDRPVEIAIFHIRRSVQEADNTCYRSAEVLNELDHVFGRAEIVANIFNDPPIFAGLWFMPVKVELRNFP